MKAILFLIIAFGILAAGIPLVGLVFERFPSVRSFLSAVKRVLIYRWWVIIANLKYAFQYFRITFFARLGHIHQLIETYKFVHYDRMGNPIWCTKGIGRTLANEGEKDMLEGYWLKATISTNLYARLYNDTPVITDTLALLTGEPATNGYAARTVERSAVGFPNSALDNGHWQVDSKELTFSATGGSWGPVTYAVIASVGTGTSGLLLEYLALSQARTLADGETLRFSWKIKQTSS